MRLLLRANSHRLLESSGLEVASSPDTAGRERWQWHLRLDDPHAGPMSDGASPGGAATEPGTKVSTAHTTLARGDGTASQVTLSTDPTRVTGRVETLEVGTGSRLEREERELVTLVVGRGHVLVERRHQLGELDVLVLEGDDPYEVSIEPLGDGPAALAVARLEPVDATRIAWVP